MQNKHKNDLLLGLFKFTSKELFVYSLVILLLGIFLLPQTAYFSVITDENIIKLTNEQRQSRDLKPLTANQILAQAAYNKAEALFEAQVFDHQIGDRTFSSWIKDTEYKYNVVGENLALDFITSEGTVSAWMASPSHKKNILNEGFTEIGIAVKEGVFNGAKTTIVVQIFGNPRVVKTNEVNSLLTIEENKPFLPVPSESTPLSTIVYLNPSTTPAYIAASDINGKLASSDDKIFNPTILGAHIRAEGGLTGYFQRISPFSALLETGDGGKLNSIKKFFQKEFPTNGSLLLGLIISLLLFVMLVYSLIQFFERITLSIKKINQKQTS